MTEDIFDEIECEAEEKETLRIKVLTARVLGPPDQPKPRQSWFGWKRQP